MRFDPNLTKETPRILLIDDEQSVVDTLRIALVNAGYVVTAALSGEEGLRLLDGGGRFDLLLCDFKLNGITGIETIVKAREVQPEIGAVLMTGYGNEQTILDAFTCGRVDNYLTKPFGVQDLYRAVSIAVREYGMRCSEREINAQLRTKVEEATAELAEKNALLEAKVKEAARLNLKLHQERQKLETLNEKLEKMSVTDDLTLLANHRYFVRRLAEEHGRMKRHGGALSLVLLDVDNYKKINDRFGHQVGDEALRKVAGVIRGICRKHDIAARYGGDEFVVLLPQVKIEGACVLADRLRAGAAEKSVGHKESLEPLRVSAGVATWEDGCMHEPDDLFHDADQALYCAKGAGKNRVAFSSGGESRLFPPGGGRAAGQRTSPGAAAKKRQGKGR
jgi:diguanylate cyclase (GGDEF)-like protein